MDNVATALRTTICDARVDAIDAGTTDVGGDLQIWTAGFGTLLAEIPLQATAFGAAVAGVATCNGLPLSDASADAGGVPARYRVRDRDNNVLWEGDIGSGEEVTVTPAVITAGEPVTLNTFTVTEPAS